MAHMVVGVMVMMDRKQLNNHGGGIIPSALAIVNILHEVLIDSGMI
jgi:hypothetical protein